MTTTTPTFEPVPTTLAEVLDPTWLAVALDDIGDDDSIVAVDHVDDSRTVAEKVQFSVTVEGADGRRRTAGYCVKAHFTEDGPNSLGPEARFYRDIAPAIAMRSPRVYYTGIEPDSPRALVVMEDLIRNGATFLSAHQPYTIETARDSLAELATLHAASWGDPTFGGLDWLTPKMTDMAERYPADLLQRLLDDGRGPDVVPELRDAELLGEALRRTAELPRTCVIHGDVHSGNVYLDADGRACWLDFQVTQPGCYAVDLAYHLATVLDVESRRAHEADLLRHYLAELASHAVDAPSFDDAWELYTLGATHGLFLWAITQISSREVVLIHFPRLAAALTDHDTWRRLGVTG
jgi:aminoglycoside phosphotransferase (APT) family kinase protein